MVVEMMNINSNCSTGALLFSVIATSITSNGYCREVHDADNNLNVLVIIVDDLRPELGAYGIDNIVSPNIDALASKGTRFDRAYCNVPVSGASRASLLTGERPTRDKFVRSYTSAQNDSPDATTIPAWMRAKGYKTISNGKVFHHFDDFNDVWDKNWRGKPLSGSSWRDYAKLENEGDPYEMEDVEDDVYLDGQTAQQTVADLKKLAQSKEPFFLCAGFIKPHLPFTAPKKYWDLYPEESIVLPENYYEQSNTIPQIAYLAQHNWSELRGYNDIPKQGALSDKQAVNIIRGYRAALSYTDAMIGEVLTTLEKTGLAKNTVVLLFGDHGWNLGDHGLWCKHSNFETSLNTPLIIYSPQMKSQKAVGEIVEYIDIYPTICELAGVEIPEHIDGQSLKGLMSGDNKGWKDYAICKYMNGTTIIEGDYFYTQWRDQESGKIQGEMLYNHATDPLENNNLAIESENREKVNELLKKLEECRGFDYDSIGNAN